LNHTGAHKANNVMGQGLLVRRMGKKRVIAETGAGQHGVATATMAAKFGFDCTIYMGEVDVERQRPNVFWMERLGAKVVAVKDGARTLKDAINEAFRDWAANMDTTHYVLGTACGPHPFPHHGGVLPVHHRQRAARPARAAHGPTAATDLCLRGRRLERARCSAPFSTMPQSSWSVSKPAATVLKASARRALGIQDASVGVAQGYRTYFLQNSDGQMLDTHSVAAGLDYIGVSPILAHLRDAGRVRFEAATDKEVVEALALTVRSEGLIPALESAHAFVQAFKEAPTLGKDDVIVINQSGRGDKDIFTVAEAFGDPAWEDFICRKAKKYTR
jgi:tryptophan synthase beta chain